MEIGRLIEEARCEQNAAWYGPAFYSFTPHTASPDAVPLLAAVPIPVSYFRVGLP
jgi:hypothetical protein